MFMWVGKLSKIIMSSIEIYYVFFLFRNDIFILKNPVWKYRLVQKYSFSVIEKTSPVSDPEQL